MGFFLYQSLISPKKKKKKAVLQTSVQCKQSYSLKSLTKAQGINQRDKALRDHNNPAEKRRTKAFHVNAPQGYK